MVVGVTGSEASIRALAWALSAASDRGWSVDVVTAWPDLGEAFVHEVPGHYSDARGRALDGLDRALVSCGVAHDDPEVRIHVENADPVAALAACSRGAELLVLGASEAGRSRRRGSPPVSQSCQHLVGCPTVVVDGVVDVLRPSA